MGAFPSSLQPPSSSKVKTVSFAAEPSVQYIAAHRSLRKRSSLKMSQVVYTRFAGEEVTDSMLQEAAQLFSQNYGVWGEKAGSKLSGTQVRLSKDRLRAQCLPEDTTSFLVTVTVDGTLAGHAFASHWTFGDKKVCWITQLVVHQDYRERKLASGLLNNFLADDIDVYGLVSSHPAACLAAARAFGGSIEKVDLDFIKSHAQVIKDASPVRYVRDAQLRGTIFVEGNIRGNDDLVCCVDAGFFVDHSEPLEALESVRRDYDWPLGELLDGHEFFLIFEARRRARSRSLSKERDSHRKTS